MRPTSALIAAWVPDTWEEGDDPLDIDHLYGLAVDWTESEAVSSGTTPLLVTNARGVADFGNSPVAQFGRRYESTTPRSASRVRPTSPGPVLTFAPSISTLDFAMRLHRPAICVIQAGAPSWRGWAAAVGAVDLTTGETEALDETMAAAAEKLSFYKNNGYADSLAKRMIPALVGDLRDAGRLAGDGGDYVLGMALGVGASAAAVKRLAKTLERYGATVHPW